MVELQLVHPIFGKITILNERQRVHACGKNTIGNYLQKLMANCLQLDSFYYLSQDQPKYALSEKWSDGVKITIFKRNELQFKMNLQFSKISG